MEWLPNDVLLLIFVRIEVQEILLLSTLNKQLNNATNDERLWKRIFYRDKLERRVKLSPNTKYKDACLIASVRAQLNVALIGCTDHGKTR